MSEFSLIESCFVSKATSRHAGTCVCNGDDASVHALKEGQELVVSTDSAVAGVHWPHDFPLEQAADRAVCAALSDLAAMGAQACWAWVSVVAEDKVSLDSMGTGVAAALNRYEVELSGGDTVQAPLNSLNITVAGILPKGTAMQRSKAQLGDKVWMLGQAGFSALGLEQWFEGHKNGEYVRYFRDVVPKLEQAQRLRENGVQCCMDISDGLLQDAGHISLASGVGMRLELSQMPAWQKLSEQLGAAKAQQVILSGGEDYGLLFTTRAEMKDLHGIAHCIGICEQGAGVRVFYQEKHITLKGSGYDHFA